MLKHTSIHDFRLPEAPRQLEARCLGTLSGEDGQMPDFYYDFHSFAWDFFRAPRKQFSGL